MRADTRAMLQAAQRGPLLELTHWPLEAVMEAVEHRWVEVPEALDADLVITNAGKDALGEKSS